MYNKDTIVVIDGANIMHRCNAAWFGARGGAPVTSASDLDGWPVVYIFLRSLRSIVEELSPASRFVYALDSRVSPRAQFYPGYKLKRRLKHQNDADALLIAEQESPEIAMLIHWELRQLARCQTLVHEVLPLIPLGWEGYEADDVCAAVAASFPDRGVDIVSGDSDMKQLMTLPNVRVYNLGPKSRNFLRPLDPDDPADQDPARWKAIIGDKTDEVSGITQEKTARKLLYDEAEFQKALDIKTCRTKSDKGKLWREVYERNLKLVTLLGERRLFPLPPTDAVRDAVLTPSLSFDEDVFAEAALQMNFDSWYTSDGPTDKWMRQVETWRKLVPQPV